MSEEIVYKRRNLRKVNKTRWITVTALFMALNIALSSFGIPVLGGRLYLCDAIICTAALLLDPVAAFIVGGIGSFLGDFIFYPLPMFVSLATHGLQALVISLISCNAVNLSKKKYFVVCLIATIIGGIIMVTGYTLGKIFVYSNFETAMIKLPFEIAQAVLGIVLSLLLCFKFKLNKLFNKMELY
ncbi:MAG: ECF transporter S component [Lachnospiraceae bacterium]|nr:ECF transporter S component [Lachnospiraceae bacterium]